MPNPAPNPGSAESYRIVLVVSGGLAELTHNLLESIERCQGGVDRVVIVAARPAIPELAALQSRYKLHGIVPLDEISSYRELAQYDRYFENGSAEFGRFTQSKWAAIKSLLASGIQHVIYSDVDMVWRHNPVPFLRAVAQFYDLSLPTPGDGQFPPQFCTGLMSVRNSEYSHKLLDFMADLHAKAARAEPELHDQELLRRVMLNTPQMLANVFPLPEVVFADGLGAGLMIESAELDGIRVRRPDPLVFHANWTKGVENKKKMLQLTGNWLL